jgi:hypothetical protein
MAMPNNECAYGIYPIQGDAETDRPNTFTPTNVDSSDPKNPRAVCGGCDQWTMVKTVAPRRGYFNFHKSSVQREAPGFSMGSTSNNKSGKPARVRGREVYVKGKEGK